MPRLHLADLGLRPAQPLREHASGDPAAQLTEACAERRLYLLDNARRNTEVGEDIRTLSRAKADELRLPAEDFWIIDSRVVALLVFDEDDQMTGVKLITNPVEVLRYAQVREAAWHHAALACW